jgi:hypothetical protein
MMRDNCLYLDDLMEVLGDLYKLERTGGALLAKVGRLTVFLPIEMEEELRPLIGQKIGILRIDGKYLHRIIPAEKSCDLSQTMTAGRNLAEGISELD